MHLGQGTRRGHYEVRQRAQTHALRDNILPSIDDGHLRSRFVEGIIQN